MSEKKKIKLTEEERAERFKHCLEEATQWHDEKRTFWDEMYDVYEGNVDMPENIRSLMQSDVRVPWAYQQVETIIPRILDPDPRFEFNPVEKNDKQMSDLLNAIIRWQLKSDQFIRKQRGIILDACVKGIAGVKVVWRRTEKEALVKSKKGIKDRLTGNDPGFERKCLIVENRPEVLPLDMNDVFPDPAATTDSELRYVLHRLWLTKRDLKEREANGEISGVEDACATYDDSTVRHGESGAEAEARRKNRYPVFEGWWDDGTRMMMLGNTVLFDGDNPYAHLSIPFLFFSSQPKSTSLVGTSEVEKIRSIQEAVWVRQNQSIEATNMALCMVLIADPTIRNFSNLKVRPGAVIPANMGQRLDQLRIDPMSAPAYSEIESLLAAMQHVTGASPYLAGSDPSQMGVNQDTATGSMILQEEGNKRMNLKSLEYKLFLSRIAKQMVQLNSQFLSQFEVNQIVDSELDGLWKPPSTTDIPMFLDVIPEAMNEQMTKTNQRQSLVELMNIMNPMHMAPMHDGSQFSIKAIMEQTLKEYDQEPNASFPPAPPPPPMMEGPDGSQGTAPTGEPAPPSG